MRKVLIVGLLAAAASPLFAQPTPAPMAQMGMMGDKVMTRGEVQAMVQTRFARVDANRDGFVTDAEMATMHSQMRDMKMHHGEKGEMPMRDPNVAFDRLDANRDGSISREEFARNRVIQIERRVEKMQHGQPGAMGMDHGKMGAMQGMRHGGGGGGGMMGAAMLKTADANRDGKVSLAEATAGALKHFDMMDANRDGRLTPEERAAGRAQMRQMRQAG